MEVELRRKIPTLFLKLWSTCLAGKESYRRLNEDYINIIKL